MPASWDKFCLDKLAKSTERDFSKHSRNDHCKECNLKPKTNPTDILEVQLIFDIVTITDS